MPSSRDLDGKKKKRKHRKKKKSDEEEEEENRKFRIWDVIDEGQPGVEYIISNFFNHVSTTLLHLKRSRSKLMESKRMASQQEIDYLSATHGLTFNKDSSLCFELITWRRSSLWILVIFGVFNIYFGTMSYLEVSAAQRGAKRRAASSLSPPPPPPPNSNSSRPTS